MFEEYPKEVTLKDGASLTLRPMTRDDQYALYSFFIGLPEENRRWLGNDVTDRKLLEKWARNLNYDRVLPILAEYDGQDRGQCHPALPDLRLGPPYRRGPGHHYPGVPGPRSRAPCSWQELSQLAASHKVKKLLARIVTTQAPVIKAFEKAGFGLVTELKNYVKDVHQKRYADIALLVKELSPGTN